MNKVNNILNEFSVSEKMKLQVRLLKPMLNWQETILSGSFFFQRRMTLEGACHYVPPLLSLSLPLFTYLK